MFVRRSAVTLVAVLAVACSGLGGDGVGRIASADEAVDLIGDTQVTVIDVRTPEEVAEGTVVGALHLDAQVPDFEARLDALDRDATYLLYCRTGSRSGQAQALMAEMGFTSVFDARAYGDLVAAGAPTR